jgi:hypothetical protein
VSVEDVRSVEDFEEPPGHGADFSVGFGELRASEAHGCFSGPFSVITLQSCEYFLLSFTIQSTNLRLGTLIQLKPSFHHWKLIEI